MSLIDCVLIGFATTLKFKFNSIGVRYGNETELTADKTEPDLSFLVSNILGHLYFKKR